MNRRCSPFRSRGNTVPCVRWSLFSVCLFAVSAVFAEPGMDASTNGREDRLRTDVTWLAAPEREGRGPGTQGIRDAADWISRQFSEIGLEPVNGIREQPFTMTLEAVLPEKQANHAEFVKLAPDGSVEVSLSLKLGETFTPLAVGGSGAFDLPLAFAGYGITAPAQEYDDYEPLGQNAVSKALLVLRQEPQKDNPHSIFNGNQATQHAALVRKIANAAEHEAGAVVVLNDCLL